MKKGMKFAIVMCVLLGVLALAVAGIGWVWGPKAQARAAADRDLAAVKLTERHTIFEEVRPWISGSIIAITMSIAAIAVSMALRNIMKTVLLPPVQSLPDQALLLPGMRVFDVRDGRASSLVEDNAVGDVKRLQVFVERPQGAELAALLLAGSVKARHGEALTVVERKALALMGEHNEK